MNGMAVIVVDIAVSEMFGSCVDTQLLPLWGFKNGYCMPSKNHVYIMQGR